MNRIVSSILALFVGVFTILFGLILAIPLTIAALITGKKDREGDKKTNRAPFHQPGQDRVLEGEYEEVTK
ncbi:hypothetical protein QW180_25630 [Vibrio sinaloensis]|nr:hypothetical protein [Vibrio sinaloensis]